MVAGEGLEGKGLGLVGDYMHAENFVYNIMTRPTR